MMLDGARVVASMPVHPRAHPLADARSGSRGYLGPPIPRPHIKFFSNSEGATTQASLISNADLPLKTNSTIASDY
jgi:hypothetical protein